MAGRRTNLGALIQIDENTARERILAAARRTAGCVRDAAKDLGVSECTLHRMLVRLDARDDFKRAGMDAA